MSTAQLAVELQGLGKRYGDCVANRSVNLAVRDGSIHAIIGENGAGKSTAMKMLYGMVRPDTGEIRVRGQACHFKSPQDAIRAGIGMVHQHFMLAGPYSVLENILLGAETSGAAWNWLPRFLRPMDLAGARAQLEAISRQYGLRADWDARIEDLSVGIQQRIEIIKLLYRQARILILDEPTAVLTPQETVELFVQLKKLRSEGKTILIITHKLKEVLSLADEATVFRAGETVGHRMISETNEEDLASLMVGRKVNLRVSAHAPAQVGAPALEVQSISLDSESDPAKPLLNQIDFQVRAGEVVGIAGVEGNGQSELLQILLHPRDYLHRAKGKIKVLDQVTFSSLAGAPDTSTHSMSAQGTATVGSGRAARATSSLRTSMTTSMTTEEIKNLGVGAVPEDRHHEGLLLDRPVTESFLLGQQRKEPFSRAGILSSRAVEEATLRSIDEYDVRPRRVDVHARGLSGGNQQKLIIARELRSQPKLLIIAQPTRGVDVGAIEFIHHRILEARTRGAGVLLVSSELDELMALSDRILVMYSGKIVAEFAQGQADEKTLGLAMGGAGAV